MITYLAGVVEKEIWDNAQQTRDSIGAATSQISLEHAIISTRFEWGTQIWRSRTEASLNPASRSLDLKSTFNAENFVGTLSWSISSHVDAIHFFVRRSPTEGAV